MTKKNLHEKDKIPSTVGGTEPKPFNRNFELSRTDREFIQI